MLESEHWTLEAAEHVEIGRFGRKGHGRGGERGLAIESCAGEAGPGQEVGDGFQVDFVTQKKASFPGPDFSESLWKSGHSWLRRQR
jgi:hypothetical protein